MITTKIFSLVLVALLSETEVPGPRPDLLVHVGTCEFTSEQEKGRRTDRREFTSTPT